MIDSGRLIDVGTSAGETFFTIRNPRERDHSYKTNAPLDEIKSMLGADVVFDVDGERAYNVILHLGRQREFVLDRLPVIVRMMKAEAQRTKTHCYRRIRTFVGSLEISVTWNGKRTTTRFSRSGDALSRADVETRLAAAESAMR